MPSISQAATPMKPRANPGNRTRQPKGCADRIAKPARLSRTSQNHLMTIILNKTGAATVAQHDCEPLAVHAQSETAARKRHVLCANFSKTRALFLLLSHRPQRKGRGGLPTGVCLLYMQHWNVCTVVFWRVVWYLRGRDRINVVPVVAVCLSGRGRGGRSVAAWRGCCGHGSRPSPWPWWPRRFFVSPPCGCDTPNNWRYSAVFMWCGLS